MEDIFTPEEFQKIKDTFKAYDEDNDGKLKNEEFEPALRALSYNPSPEDIEDMLDDAKGELTFDAFLYLIVYYSRAINPKQELIDSFEVFDKEKSGTLPIETIKKILQNVRRPFTDEQINEVMKNLTIQNGRVQYSELAEQLLTPI